MKIERKIKTLTAQGKLQGIIVSLMPVFLALIMTMLKPEMMIGFFLSPVGAISVLATIVLIVLGWWMISKIVKIDI
jgi:tight adherence protein B